MSKAKKTNVDGTTNKTQFAVLNDQNLSKDQIATWLYQDIRRAHIVITEILQDKSIMSILADKYYDRYKQMMAEKQNAPELNLQDDAD